MSKSSLAIMALPAETRAALVRLGKRLQLARKKRNSSLAELAKDAGINAKTAAKIERGDPSVALRMVIAVMLAMNMEKDIEEIAGPLPEEFSDSSLKSEVFEERIQAPLVRLGGRIRQLRKFRKLRIVDMAKSMYASPVTVRQLETGSRSVSLGIAAAALDILHREKDFEKVAQAANDRTGMSLDAHRQFNRKRIRRKSLKMAA